MKEFLLNCLEWTAKIFISVVFVIAIIISIPFMIIFGGVTHRRIGR